MKIINLELIFGQVSDVIRYRQLMVFIMCHLLKVYDYYYES